MKRGLRIILFIFAAVIFSIGCRGNDVSKVSRPLLGTVVTITIADVPGKTSGAFNAAFNEIEYVQKSFSIYDKDSEISKLNEDAYKHPVIVSEDLFSLVKDTIKVSEKTGGTFDITWASTGKLWDFSREEFTPPDDKTIKALLPLISYKNIMLDENRKSVKFLKSGTKIGVGGVAKGYAVKRAAASLRNSGVRGAIIACAGDIQVIGDNNGKPWRAGIQDPRGSSVIATFDMRDGDSVSTSGDYERFRILNDKRYHHIIDPSTGYPADSGLISVTVFSKDPLITDAYSTAFFVAGLDRTKRILSSMNNAAAVLVDSGMKVHVSSSLKGVIFFREDLGVDYF